VIAVEDERKGEQLLLFVQGSETIDLRKRLRQVLDQPLWVPAQVVPVKEIPLLGSGKRDYGLMKRNAVAAWNRR
jgi:acyl-[acyl-carrier-protein]-phospholipid O-acyltransferase/long-chain-fatty-acid--[acyl-carrier-protein] ligase